MTLNEWRFFPSSRWKCVRWSRTDNRLIRYIWSSSSVCLACGRIGHHYLPGMRLREERTIESIRQIEPWMTHRLAIDLNRAYCSPSRSKEEEEKKERISQKRRRLNRRHPNEASARLTYLSIDQGEIHYQLRVEKAINLCDDLISRLSNDRCSEVRFPTWRNYQQWDEQTLLINDRETGEKLLNKITISDIIHYSRFQIDCTPLGNRSKLRYRERLSSLKGIMQLYRESIAHFPQRSPTIDYPRKKQLLLFLSQTSTESRDKGRRKNERKKKMFRLECFFFSVPFKSFRTEQTKRIAFYSPNLIEDKWLMNRIERY